MKLIHKLCNPDKRGLPAIYEKPVDKYWAHFDGFALFTTVVLILGFAYTTYLGQGYLSDEGFHMPMIQAILEGKWGNLPTNVTTPPYYHAFLAFFAQLPGVEGQQQLQVLRAVQFTISALAVPIFYNLAKFLRHTDCDLRTLACLVCPVFLPFTGLVYTDTPALTLTLAMIACTLTGRYWLAGLFGVLGLGIRQMGIIWACFCGCWIIFNFYHVHGSQFFKIRKLAFELLPRLIPYLIMAALFMTYLITNGGAVAGDRSAHSVSFNPTNVYIWLIGSFVLFFPLNIEYAKDHWESLVTKTWLWFFIPLMFIAYLYFFKITHVYNFGNTWWAHNKLLQFVTSSLYLKILFFLPATWMAMTYVHAARVSSKPWMLYLLLAFSVISFLPMPMVDFRYYMIAITLFMLWRPPSSSFSTKAMLLMYIGMTIYTLHATAMRWFFP